MEYRTYILGKDDYEINPNAKAITVKDVKEASVGYTITYRVPWEIVQELLSEE